MESNYVHTSSTGHRVVGKLDSDLNFVTVRDSGLGQIIYMSFDFSSYNTEMAMLLANAVEWSGGKTWLSMDPSSGTNPPGTTQDVTIQITSYNFV